MAPASTNRTTRDEGGSRIRRRAGVRLVTGSRAEERALAFTVAAAIPLYLALRDGGLDIAPRHEVAVVIWWALALALAFRLLPRARLTKPGRIVLSLAAGLIAWSALALLWTDSAERTTVELARDVALLGIVVICLLALTRESWTAAASGLSIAALAVPVLALVARLAPDLFYEAQLDAAFGGRRLAFPLDYWNALAAWGAMAVAIGLGWSVHLRSTFRSGLALAAVPIAGLVVYLTYSRGGVLAACAGIIAVVVLSRSRAVAAAHAALAVAATSACVLAVRAAPDIANGDGAGGAAGVALAVLAACAACAALPAGLRRSRLPSRVVPARVVVPTAAVAALMAIGLAFAISSGNEGDSLSADDPKARSDPAARLLSADGTRGQLWAGALDAFEANPVTGIGPGTYDLFWRAGGAEREAVRDAHSLYLERLAELGIPGLALLLAFLGALSIGVLATRRAAVLLPHGHGGAELAAVTALGGAFFAFCVHAAVDWLWEATAVGALALGAAGIATAGGGAARRHLPGTAPVRAAAVALAIAAGASQVPALVSEERMRASASALGDGNEAEGRRLAGSAIEARPWAASPYAWRATLQLELGDFDAARRDARNAIERERTDAEHRVLLARIELADGNRAAAVAALSDAARLNPGYGSIAETAASRLEKLETGRERRPRWTRWW